MTFTPTALKFSVPRMNHDKIIGTLSGTVTVRAVSGSPVTVNTTHNTGFNDSCLFEGIYSIDGGATWNDMGAMVPDLSAPATPVFQTLDCVVTSATSGIITVQTTNYPSPISGTGPARTVLYKLVLFAKSDQKPLTPLPIAADSLKYSSRYNFQKIFIDQLVSLHIPVGATNSISLSHSLGYKPNVRAWLVEPINSSVQTVPFYIELRVDENNVSFFYDNTTGFVAEDYNFICRVYYDG